jgi:uncharacterized membrane protein YbhN (UPF0104 family)
MAQPLPIMVSLNKLWKPILLLSGISLLLYQALAGEAMEQWSLLAQGMMQKQSLGYGILFFLLIFLNWWVESLKWHLLAGVHLPALSLGQAWKSVCLGISLGMITPGRIGDYGGRVLALGTKKAWQLVGSNLLGSLLQLTVLMVLGLASLYTLLPSLPLPFALSLDVLKGWLVFFIVLGILWVSLPKWAVFHPMTAKIKQKIGTKIQGLNVVKLYSWGSLLTVVGLTVTRALIFALQYYLLLLFVGAKGGLVYFLMVWVVFLLQTLSPLPALVEWFVRGEIALLCWSALQLSAPQILTATYTLWLGNLLLPGLLGFFYLSNQSIVLPYDAIPDKIDKLKFSSVFKWRRPHRF